MEHHQISKLLNGSTFFKFLTRKWIEVNALSSDQCSANKEITFKILMWRSDLCDYIDVYIVVKGTLDL